MRLYVWNAKLCAALYLPTQIAEVSIRNAIHFALTDKHGPNWHERGSFLCTLPHRLREELADVIRVERGAYGKAMTTDHLVSGLSFGFWLHLLTKNYTGVFWPRYFANSFPHKPANVGQVELYDRIDRVRSLRNRMAHHKPVFDRAPSAEYQNLMELVSWICGETHWFIGMNSRVHQTINDRPPV